MDRFPGIVGDAPTIVRLRGQLEQILKAVGAARRLPPVLIQAVRLGLTSV